MRLPFPARAVRFSAPRPPEEARRRPSARFRGGKRPLPRPGGLGGSGGRGPTVALQAVSRDARSLRSASPTLLEQHQSPTVRSYSKA